MLEYQYRHDRTLFSELLFLRKLLNTFPTDRMNNAKVLYDKLAFKLKLWLIIVNTLE